MTTIALGVFMFTFMILALVAVLMVAKKKLVAGRTSRFDSANRKNRENQASNRLG